MQSLTGHGQIAELEALAAAAFIEGELQATLDQCPYAAFRPSPPEVNSADALLEESKALALGLWLVISPLVLGFSASKLLATTTVTLGILVTALATSALLREIHLRQWWHQHHGAS